MLKALPFMPFCFFLLSNKTLLAQFVISGELRPRAEFRNGFQSLPDSTTRPSFFVEQRSRLNLAYATDKTEYKLVLQDVRVWGNQKQLVGNQDLATSVHEAFAIVKFTPTWSMKLGRQELSYDDHRILGNVDWAQQARSHDALLFCHEKKGWKWHVGGAYNQDGTRNYHTRYTVPNSYKTMVFTWANHKFTKAFSASFLAMGVGQQVNLVDKDSLPSYHENYTITTGTRLAYKKKRFEAASNIYMQLGSQASWPARETRAWNVLLNLNYKLGERWVAGMGYEGFSGNSQTDTTLAYRKIQRAFNPYFGTNHKFNGEMDYFYVAGNHIGSVGLHDIHLTIKYKRPKFFAKLVPHVFFAQSKILDREVFGVSGIITGMDPHLGTEIDLSGGFEISEEVSCMFGYCQMLATPTMQALTGGDYKLTANWAWVMLVYKPQMFKYERPSATVTAVQ
jgi:hypothetical protein